MFTSDNKEDKVLFSRADDIVELSSVRNKPCFLGFLNEREEYILRKYLDWNRDDIYFFGGYENSQRKMICCCNYPVENDEFPIKAIYFKYRKVDCLSHRDFLGALISLGIDRSCIGDILVGEGTAVCYVKEEVYDYIVSQISRIGRTGVTITDKITVKHEKNNELVEYNVSSVRMDVVVSAITGLSRSRTNEEILSGKVFINYCENKNFSYNLVVGDVLTIRGKGKFIFKEIIGVTKKKRLKILIEQYR